ncbi:MAG: NHL repeat-containing protein, partial [Acidobacteriota bacterium]
MRRLSICGLTVLICLTVPLLSLAQDIITTAAGATWTFPGDGGAATDAPLGEVQAVAIDAAGNVFAADTGNNLVVKISPTGVLTVVAGNGIRGFSGDGGPATSASLNQPTSVTVDIAGNLFIVDKDNQRIRKVTPGGTITTVAGNGDFGFTGDGGAATSASLNFPRGVAVDADGNLYIADTYSNRIRKITPGGTITTVAGSGSADPGAGGFSGDGGPATSALLDVPTGVAVDGTGNLYIADGSNRVRKISSGGIIDTVAGTGIEDFSGDEGPAISATLNQAFGVAVDESGNLYIADTVNNRIRKVTPDGTINTVAGSGGTGRSAGALSGDDGPATSASLNLPSGVAVDAGGNVYIADTVNQRVRKVSSAGTITTLAGDNLFKFSGDGGPATSASLNFPTSA